MPAAPSHVLRPSSPAVHYGPEGLSAISVSHKASSIPVHTHGGAAGTAVLDGVAFDSQEHEHGPLSAEQHLDGIITAEQLGLKMFTLKELAFATSDFCKTTQIMPGLGKSIYQGQIENEKVLIISYDKCNLLQRKEALQRYTSAPSRLNSGLAQLVGLSFEEGPSMWLVFDFNYESNLKDQLTALNLAEKVKMALDIAKSIQHIISEDTPVVPDSFKIDHIYLGPGHKPVLMDVGNASQGLGNTLSAILNITRCYGLFLADLIVDSEGDGSDETVKSLRKLSFDCSNENEYSRPSFEQIVDKLEEISCSVGSI